jgi:hypothetical protein
MDELRGGTSKNAAEMEEMMTRENSKLSDSALRNEREGQQERS